VHKISSGLGLSAAPPPPPPEPESFTDKLKHSFSGHHHETAPPPPPEPASFTNQVKHSLSGHHHEHAAPPPPKSESLLDKFHIHNHQEEVVPLKEGNLVDKVKDKLHEHHHKEEVPMTFKEKIRDQVESALGGGSKAEREEGDFSYPFILLLPFLYAILPVFLLWDFRYFIPIPFFDWLVVNLY
jgi:hypothetical protein